MCFDNIALFEVCNISSTFISTPLLSFFGVFNYYYYLIILSLFILKNKTLFQICTRSENRLNINKECVGENVCNIL